MARARLLLPVCLFVVEILEATVAVGDHVAQRLMRSADERALQHKIGVKQPTHVTALVDAWGGMSHAMNSIQAPSQPQVVVGNPNTAATAMVPASGVPVAQSATMVPGVAPVPLVANSVAGLPPGLQPMAPQAAPPQGGPVASTIPTAAAAAAPPQGGPVAAVVPTANATIPNATNSGNSQDGNPLFRVLFIVALVGIGAGALVLYYIAVTTERRPRTIINTIQATEKDQEALQKSKMPAAYGPSGGQNGQTGGVTDSSEDEKMTLPEPEGEAATRPNSQANGSGASGSGANGAAR